MRKRMLARTYQPKFFSNMAVGVPEGRCTKTFLAAVSFSRGTAFFIAVDVAEDLSEHSFKLKKKENQWTIQSPCPDYLTALMVTVRYTASWLGKLLDALGSNAAA